jgi:hypothetical protein
VVNAEEVKEADRVYVEVADRPVRHAPLAPVPPALVQRRDPRLEQPARNLRRGLDLEEI